MPTALTEQNHHHPTLMRPSFSSNTTLPSSRFLNTNTKTTPPITTATVISFEKRSDQKIWYTIRVEPLATKKYFISRKYEDFSQFSQKLHDRFNTTKYRAGSRLPPKIKNRLQLLPTSKQIHAQRVQELNQFLSILFQKQSIITDSYIVLEFFDNNSMMMTPPLSPDEKMEEDGAEEQENNNTTSRWKRLRCTSFLARSNATGAAPPSPTSSSSTAGLSSLCSQAANRIIPSWNRSNHSSTTSCTPQPSLSTPTSNKKHMTTIQQQRQSKQALKKSKSSIGIYSSLQQEQPQHPLDYDNSNGNMMITPSISSSISSINQHQHQHQIKTTIKIKVIYDVDNIIVIQVPRTITLEDLRSRIAQKFSDPGMGSTVQQEEFVLLFSDNSSSCCSIASSNNNKNDNMMLPAVLINKEQDLTQLMKTKWNRLEKVTLRCIM